MNGTFKTRIMANRASASLGTMISSILGTELVLVDTRDFNDGEIYTRLLESLHGEDVYIIANTGQPEINIREAKHLLSLAYQAGPGSITLFVPYLGYGRQDRAVKDREAVALVEHVREICNTIPASVLKVVLFDLHNDSATEACFQAFHVRTQHIFTSFVIVDYLKREINLEDAVVASPDVGGVKRAKKYAEFLETGLVMFYKTRTGHGEIGQTQILGDVTGKTVVFVDDMIDTGGTILKSSDMALEQGAKEVYICATHGLLSKDAVKKIEASNIRKMYITDTINHAELIGAEKIEVISVAPLIAGAIRKLHDGESISTLRFRD